MNLDLARHYLEVQRPERALEALGQPGADLDDPQWYELRGLALYDLDRYDEARRMAQDGLALGPTDVTLLALLCDCERELGNLGAAEKAILAALELEPLEPALLCAYAHLCARGGQMKKAGRLLAEAESVDPESLPVLRTRVWLAYLKGDRKATEREARALLAAEPEDALGHTVLGAQLHERGSMWASRRHYETAASVHTGEAEIVDAAREMRIENHWIFWPLWPVHRFGPARVWLAAIAFFVLGGALRLPSPVLVAGMLLYLALVLYSWTVPRLARRWLRRRYL